MILFSLTNAASGRPRMLALLLCAVLMLGAVACAKRSRTTPPSPPSATITNSTPASATTQPININTASAKELETLPAIGEGLAQRIIEHRENYGPFRRTEHLMMVRGISETRFRAMRHLITVE